ncbi:hypothetical protein D9M71_811030 [compost metagenome]
MAEIALKCANCGSKKFDVPRHPKSDSVVTCSGCGAKGLYGKLMGDGVAQAKKAIERELGKLFKR